MKILLTILSVIYSLVFSAMNKTRMKQILSFILLFTPVYGQTTYYISSSGNDANNGTSTAKPWKTLDKVSSVNYAAGDRILLKRGDVFSGEISSAYGWKNGTESQPIIFGAYGTGAKPLIYGDMTGAVWTKSPYRDSVWQAWSGYVLDAFGYEDSCGIQWHSITKIATEIHFYLSNQDSLKKYIHSFTNHACFGWGNDTVWIKTSDGNSPVAKIFRINNLSGTHVIVRDLELRNWYDAIYALGAVNNSYINLTIRNTMSMAIYLAGGCRNTIVDSCTIDSTNYTALYTGIGGYRNVISHNTVRNVVNNVLGMPRIGSEMCGIGMQQDTACVAEYNTIEYVSDAGFDSYFNVNDTIRYNIITHTPGDIWLTGINWVAHNNIFSGSSPGVAVFNTAFLPPELGGNSTSRPTTAHVYDNTLTISGECGLKAINASPDNGTIIFDHNSIHSTNMNSSFDSFEAGTISSMSNTFFGVGKWSTGTWPNQTYYNTLAAFQKATGLEAGSVYSTASVHSESIHPMKIELEQNYPNPFNPSTVITYQLSVPGKVRLSVYDILGREIAILVDGKKRAGNYSETLDGSKLSSGTYFTRFIFNPENGKQIVQIKKILLTK